jgi:hypothetical protein
MLMFDVKSLEAKEVFERLFSSETPVSYEQCKGLSFPLHYGYPLRYEWSMALAGSLPDSAAMAQARHRLIRFFSAANLATIAQGGENPSDDEAVHWYEKANSLVHGHPQVTLPLARLYMKKGHRQTRELCRAVLCGNPFCIDFWKEWAMYLYNTGAIDEGRQFIESCLLCLSRLQLSTPEMIDSFTGLQKMAGAQSRQ